MARKTCILLCWYLREASCVNLNEMLCTYIVQVRWHLYVSGSGTNYITRNLIILKVYTKNVDRHSLSPHFTTLLGHKSELLLTYFILISHVVLVWGSGRGIWNRDLNILPTKMIFNQLILLKESLSPSKMYKLKSVLRLFHSKLDPRFWQITTVW